MTILAADVECGAADILLSVTVAPPRHPAL